MIKRKFLIAFSLLIYVVPTTAQELQQTDVTVLLKQIPPIPATVEGLHHAFTIKTKFGEKFSDAELLNPVYEQIKQLVISIHDPAIRARIKNAPRKDMPDTVQYEDERWKLALRPLLDADIQSRLSKTDPAYRAKVLEAFELQKIFDWTVYYKEDEKLKKQFREKEGGLAIENDMQKAIKKLELQDNLFLQQRNLWMNRFTKYAKGLSRLQELLQQIDYGRGYKPEESKFVLTVLKDIQARAFEAIEKLVWSEMSIVMSGELLFTDKHILNAFK